MTNAQSGRPLRILIIGSLDGAEGGARAGGTAILLGALIAELRRRRDVEPCVLDIGDRSGWPRPLAAARRAAVFVLGMVWRIYHVDVVTLHAVTTKLWFTGVAALLLSRIAGKPLLIRKFAGTDYNDFGWWRRTVTRWVLGRCDTYLAETKYLVAAAHQRDGITHCRWFPTHRALGDRAPREQGAADSRRFVFVGQVREYKGLRELVDAAERPDQEATVDVYGPLFDDLPADLFNDRRRIFYRGYLNREDVVPTMQQYGSLVFPTKATTEGYPGAILEAYAAGIPVIATACGAIPEIVDDSCGILIPPADAGAIWKAMKALSEDSELYERLRLGASKRAREYSAEHWADEFVGFCCTISGRAHVRSGSG